MHFVILIFGFTGILGKLISIESIPLVFWRTLIGGGAILIWLIARGKVSKKTTSDLLKMAGVGILVAIHWITFFESINQSNVSIALKKKAKEQLATSRSEEAVNMVDSEVPLDRQQIRELVNKEAQNLAEKFARAEVKKQLEISKTVLDFSSFSSWY